MAVAVPDALGMLERARRSLALATQDRVRAVAWREQWLVDIEVRETRRSLLRELRRCLGTGAAGFVDEYLWAVADLPTVLAAIVQVAATVGPDARADLQLWDAEAQLLRIEAHKGFSTPFLETFATLGPEHPTACAAAWRTRGPVLIEDVARSRLFHGTVTRAPILEAGSKAVYSYPLLDRGEPVGVLSFHSGRSLPRDKTDVLARTAQTALCRARRNNTASTSVAAHSSIAPSSVADCVRD